MEEEINVKEKLNEGYVKAILIVEVLGRPTDYVREAIRKVVKTMQEDKELILLNKRFFRPKQIKEAKNLFTSFTEVEILAKDFSKLCQVCFDYMPSSIEIIEPTELKLSFRDANSFINDITQRLHAYDAVAKRWSLEKQILQNMLSEAQEAQTRMNQVKKKSEGSEEGQDRLDESVMGMDKDESESKD